MAKSSAPTEYYKAITPHDVNTLTDHSAQPMTTRGISVASSGLVKCRDAGGVSTLIYITAGVILPIVTDRIELTGTTATGIVAYW